MNVCILGNGLISLSLAKNLINKKINVDIYYKKRNLNKLSSTRTIGIAKSNLEFFRNEILQIAEKDVWPIKNIKIYSEKIKKEEIFNFQDNNKNLFYMIKNDKFYNLLNSRLFKSKLFKKLIIKNDNLYQKLLKEKKYDLIINCDQGNFLSKKYFSKTIDKDYDNLAFTTIIEHEVLENNIAVQIFTKYGPIAFLPISNSQTSVVYSFEIKNRKYKDDQILELIKKNNLTYKIKKIHSINSFKLKSSIPRSYYYKNILAFGDLLHKIHPLAGQGFNMTIRDIKTLSEIIQTKINLGIQLDQTVLEEFENKTRYKNFIFSSGIDFIFEFFNFEKNTKDRNLNKILKLLGKNKSFKNIFIKIADKGLNA